MELNEYELQRVQKSKELKELGINPYPHNIKKELSTVEFLEKFDYVKESESKRDEEKSGCVAGRIKFLRLMGKAAFLKIEDDEGVLQVYIARDALGEEWFKNIKKYIEVGDIIKVCGFPFVTKTGELTLHAKELQLASKAITPLPEKFHGLSDKELRYRQRYLDMIMNKEVAKVFKTRSIIISTIRAFFERKGFLEVETPMMHPIAGGANAKPFVTYHNALGVERYLRIAPELYLKRLIVGGFEAVFEINRNFRNEGMDLTHNPEFTMIEFYWAYHNYKDLMALTEELFLELLKKLNLPTKLKYADMEIDFSAPFAKITYDDSLVDIGKIPREIINDKEKIVTFLKDNGVKIKEGLDLGHLKAELFDNFVEDKLINPTFVMDFPISISPLSRRSDEDPNIAERFELFCAGKEIANGFNELNDPLDQYERFKSQIDAKNAGDDEAHEMDEDYVKALCYAMPPTAGEGIGIDRLTMLLTNQQSIRDVILFPAMRPLENNKKEDK
ncbi:MAG: lysine--tRNA ligase [Epsilonproteobacteria bacterium]|nr:lysine--tRNA ligase [Campylobacterota bacterium]